MAEPKPTCHLARGMVGVAMSALLLGLLLIGVTSWKAPGCVLVTYGLLILYLAHHVSAAPCLEDRDSEPATRVPASTPDRPLRV